MIIREIDWRSPLDAFAPLAGQAHASLLHPGESASGARWSAIAAFPSALFEVRGAEVSVNGRTSADPPFLALRRFAGERAGKRSAAPAFPDGAAPDFLGGLCGFVGYEMGAALEPSAAGPSSAFALPDMAFGAYDALAHFDRKARRAFITAYTEEAAGRLEQGLGKAARERRRLPAFGAPRSNFSRDAYERAVAGVVDLIRDGALFQANLSQQISADASGEIAPLDLFEQIAMGDAPFAALLNYEGGAVLSNSPERFFRIAQGRIVAEPIKGTRRRSPRRSEDAALAQALLADPKERAENIMIADLIRNDLSRVCRDHSIREDAVCALASFANVHHLVSRISGLLREECGAVDALVALFPCGSVTGAPKVEAMKTIAAAEKTGRGPYCGAIGFVDDAGCAEFSVAIRLLIVSADRRRVVIPVGGGVTLRSDPAEEYVETLVKARGALAAIGAANIL
ncbi:MAG: aminodeoxychorismate synthase, component I [Alphaproteobacteria bacterium]|nr:aminodeoxychorismate synthase, component I [Alphaproteobacteria bacterium]